MCQVRETAKLISSTNLTKCCSLPVEGSVNTRIDLNTYAEALLSTASTLHIARGLRLK